MVILYNPASTTQRKPVLPMSLLAVAALLEGDCDCTIVDGNLERDPVGVIDRVLRASDDAILGVTVMPGPQVRRAVPDCRRLKALHPDLTVVWGGYFPTQHYDVCLRADYVDYVVLGHGEVAFKKLVDALRKGEDAAGLEGLAYKDPRTGEIRSSGVAPMPDPDELPVFPYHRVDVGHYVRSTFLGERTLAHHSSYGCPFSCDFCAVVHMADGRWKAESAERTAEAARRLVTRWGADAVEFYDNNFFVQEARTAAFAEGVMDLGIAWWGESRVDTLLAYSDRTWELMRDSGLRMVFMGAESGSDETLRRMNKGGSASAERTLALAERMKRYDVIPEYSFILGNPPAPEEDAEQTMAFIRQVKRVNPATEIVIYVYTPVPSSGGLFEQARAEGFAFPETLDEWVGADWQAFSQRRSSRTPWVGEPLRRRIRGFETVINAHYPTVTDPRLRGWRRRVLQAASAWRYHLGFYDHPWELQALRKLLPYQRPETTGF